MFFLLNSRRVAGYKFNFYERNHATQVLFHGAHNFLLILQKIGIRRSFVSQFAQIKKTVSWKTLAAMETAAAVAAAARGLH